MDVSSDDLPNRKNTALGQSSSSTAGECDKYLPRQVPVVNISKEEKQKGAYLYNALKDSSFLIEELSTGKLMSTIKVTIMCCKD